jgi:hypothetical protein
MSNIFFHLIIIQVLVEKHKLYTSSSIIIESLSHFCNIIAFLQWGAVDPQAWWQPTHKLLTSINELVIVIVKICFYLTFMLPVWIFEC